MPNFTVRTVAIAFKFTILDTGRRDDVRSHWSSEPISADKIYELAHLPDIVMWRAAICSIEL